MLNYLLALVKKYNTFFKLECTCGIRARCGALQRLHIRKSSMNCKNLQEGVCWCLLGTQVTLERKIMIRATEVRAN